MKLISTGLIVLFCIIAESIDAAHQRNRYDTYCRQHPINCKRNRDNLRHYHRSRCESSSGSSQSAEPCDKLCDPNSIVTDNPDASDKTRTRVMLFDNRHSLELIFICKRNETYNVIGDSGAIVVAQRPYHRPIKIVCSASGQWLGYKSNSIVTGFYCASANSSSSSSSTSSTTPAPTSTSFAISCQKFAGCHSCVEHAECSYCQSATAPVCIDRLTANSSCDVVDNLITYAYDCPKPPKHEFEYSDEFARTKVLPLCAAAYSIDPTVCLTNGSFRLYQQRTVDCDVQHHNCSVFTATSVEDRAIIIAFRGTKYNQLTYEISTIINTKTTKPFPTGGHVIGYFHDAFYALWNNGLRNDFVTLQQRHPSYELWVVGHSLGAALASLGASLIAHSNYIDAKRIRLVTMGQPRTGDIAFAKAHDHLLPYSYRIVHSFDVIADNPSLDPAYAFHHRYDVWYNNSMTTADYRVCTRADNDGCNNGCPGANACISGSATCPDGVLPCLLGTSGCPGIYQCLQGIVACPALEVCLFNSTLTGYVGCFEANPCPTVIACLSGGGANNCPNLIECFLSGSNGCPSVISCFSGSDCALTSLIDHAYYFNQDVGSICP